MRLPKEVKRALDDTGLPWKVEKGTKHYKIKLAGRMVGILPLNLKARHGYTNHTIKNTVGQIKRSKKDD